MALAACAQTRPAAQSLATLAAGPPRCSARGGRCRGGRRCERPPPCTCGARPQISRRAHTRALRSDARDPLRAEPVEHPWRGARQGGVMPPARQQVVWGEATRQARAHMGRPPPAGQSRWCEPRTRTLWFDFSVGGANNEIPTGRCMICLPGWISPVGGMATVMQLRFVFVVYVAGCVLTDHFRNHRF